jgi:hypothetical protein
VFEHAISNEFPGCWRSTSKRTIGHSLVLLLLFFRDDWISEVVLARAVYAFLVIVILKIFWNDPAAASASPDGLLPRSDDHLYLRSRATLQIANWLILSIFFGYVSLAFFSLLEKAGPINRAKLDACLDLYLIPAKFYYAIFSLM